MVDFTFYLLMIIGLWELFYWFKVLRFFGLERLLRTESTEDY